MRRGPGGWPGNPCRPARRKMALRRAPVTARIAATATGIVRGRAHRGQGPTGPGTTAGDERVRDPFA